MLHKTAGEIEAMPYREYSEWFSYFSMKKELEKKEEEKRKGNLLAMDEDDIIGSLT